MGLILCFPKQKLTNQSHSYIFQIAAIWHEICTEVTWQYYFYICDSQALLLFIAEPLSLTCQPSAEDAVFYFKCSCT